MTAPTHRLASLRLWSLGDDALRKAGDAIDQAKPRQANGQLSSPEIAWARKQLDQFDAGQTCAFDKLVTDSSAIEFRRAFDQIEALFVDPEKHLDLIRRPPLNIAGQRFEQVFELPSDRSLEETLAVMQRSGYDLIVVRNDATKQVYVALNEGGHVKRCQSGAEAVLESEHYDQVRIVWVEDTNNGFWEGLTLIPRRIGQFVSDLFSAGKNRSKRIEDTEAVETPVSDYVGFSTAASIAMPKPEATASVPGAITAAAVMLGAVSVSTLIATAPEAAMVLGVISGAGSLYNAAHGYFRKRDPYFILNQAGVQLSCPAIDIGRAAPVKVPS